MGECPSVINYIVMHDYGIVEQQAPELQVAKWVNEQGNEIDSVHLSDFKGKKVVIFGFQSWCPGCHSRGLPTLQKLVAHYKDREDVVFLAVQTVFEGFEVNTYEKMKEVQNQYALEIPFGQDVGDAATDNRSSVMYHYKTGGTPWFIFLNEEHMVVFNDFHIDIETAKRYIDTV